MNSRDWLRAMVLRSRRTPSKRPEFATGGLIPAHSAPILMTGCTASARQPAELPAGTVIQIRDLGDAPLTQDEIDGPDVLHEAFDRAYERATRAANYQATLAVHRQLEPGLLDKPLPVWTMCPCFAVYSRCYCPART